jgi:hypothetical protein
MNIPLDRLYHYIENIAQEIYNDRIVIYRFWPHGSKNINNLNELDGSTTWTERTMYPSIWCNDQEPLDYEFYRKNNIQERAPRMFDEILKSIGCFKLPKNLNWQPTIFDKNLLLHSEKRSHNLKTYQEAGELIPVYYWSHAVIARDWFRYAEHVAQQKQVNKTFLIYNRAWSGTREYRLRFAELITRLGLENDCRMSVNPIEPELGIHYELHQFNNPAWRPQTVLENFFPISDAHSNYSADFDIEDYEATDIEVVLETLFDDGRLHLTEKALRPIALGQPFILAGTHGSLEYLRSYGFKTFSDVWDEGYDLIEDPEERLYAIADLMKYISTWLPPQRERNIAQARAIAEYNKKRFFSQEFFDLVVNELKTNLKFVFDEFIIHNNYQPWISRWNELMAHPEIIEFLNNNKNTKSPTKSQVEFIMNLAKSKLAEKTLQ